MKKTLLAFIVIIILSFNANAQYKPFQFGLKIAPGINMTKLNSDNISEKTNAFSFNWGFVGNFYFVENYGISTGFNINNIKGGYAYNDNISGKLNRTINNQYIEIPLSLIMRTEKIGKTRIIGNIGYGMGFLLNSEQKDININKEEIPSIEEFCKIRHALIIKLGVEHNVYKASCLTMALVYNNNFINIYKKNNSHEHNILLNNLSLEIGFMF